MRVTEITYYTCVHCGRSYLDDRRGCEQHERECRNMPEMLRMVLHHNYINDTFYITSEKIRAQLGISYKTDVAEYGEDIGDFTIYTTDLSEEGKERCKKSLLQEAIRLLEQEKWNYAERISRLQKKLSDGEVQEVTPEKMIKLQNGEEN